MSSWAMGSPTGQEQPREVSVQEAYFIWLYDRVFDVWDAASADSFTAVCSLMHQIAFTPLVEHDENRIAEAAGLRNDFHKQAGSMGPGELSDLMMPDASVFEVLVALAGRADFMVPLTQKVWFHIFIENLGLDKYSDQFCRSRSTWPIERIINTFNNRAYRSNGKGGIFPLRRPREDQRRVELWYQMGAYMTENAMY